MDAANRTLTVDLLVAQLGAAYDRFDAATRARHLALLNEVQAPGDVALLAEPAGGDCWTVTICTSDRVGILSIIAGLFTAYRCDISRGEVFTLRTPRQPVVHDSAGRQRGFRRSPGAASPPSRRILDVFEVQRPAGAAPDFWRRFQADLADLVSLVTAGEDEAARNRVIDLVAEVFRSTTDGEAKLLPVSIEIVNDPAAPFTRLEIASADTPGFLFAFTNAVAGFTVNVERAEIRTVAGEARDTFWVTDLAGQPITNPERIQELRVATAIVKQFTHLLPSAPNPGQALRQFHALVRQLLSRPEWTADLRSLEVPTVLGTLAGLLGESRFLWEDFLRLQHENLFPVLVDAPALDEHRDRDRLLADLQQWLAEQPDRAAQIDALNAFRDREMFRIDLRHITQRIDFRQFSAELTALAELTVQCAAALALAALRPKYGEPRLEDGSPCPWCSCALGKFGGAELGFASDLELLFVYAGEGSSSGPASLVNGEYFTRFVQEFQTIVRARQEGIFQLDLRLRPYGSKSGGLASSLAGFRKYYAATGDARQFERLALVKLRPVAGDAALGAQVVAARDEFVYSSQPLDLADIRYLRQRQATELVGSGTLNAKYSAGGLVDVEYFVQSSQIVGGAAEPSLRVTNSLAAIERLERAGRLLPGQALSLRETYVFLRRLIDALRVVRGNAKDLTIPPTDSPEFAYLSQRLRLGSPADLQREIAERMSFAKGLWEGAAPRAQADIGCPRSP